MRVTPLRRVTPQEAYDLLREAIPRRPELRFTTWPRHIVPEDVDRLCKGMHPYEGACYIATQVFCHLIPAAKPYTYERQHFWAVVDDEIWDPTFDQFDDRRREEIYQYGTPTRFKNFSKRAKELLRECQA